MQISLMCCLRSSGKNYSAHLRAHCSWPRWLHLGKVKRFVSVLWTWPVRESCLSQLISSQFNMIDLGRKSLSCSCMDGEGETVAHQSVRDADCSCMLTWQPRSGGVAKWLFPNQLLRMKVDIDLMLLLSDSFSCCYNYTALKLVSATWGGKQRYATFII